MNAGVYLAVSEVELCHINCLIIDGRESPTFIDIPLLHRYVLAVAATCAAAGGEVTAELTSIHCAKNCGKVHWSGHSSQNLKRLTRLTPQQHGGVHRNYI